MSTSICERGKAAHRLRHISSLPDPSWPSLMACLGAASRRDAVLILADLIDPAAWKNTVMDNKRLIDRCRELEIENTRLKAALGKGDER